jgi:putative FmdB family regulatory protein
MPTYEYECLNCGRRTEAVQRFSDEPLRECPSCGGPLRRVFHPVGIVLKGSGFYSTDNRGSSKHRTAERKETSSETKADTKKEAKKESAPSPSSESGSSGTSNTSSSSKKSSDNS